MEQLNDFDESLEGVVDLQEAEEVETTDPVTDEVVDVPVEKIPQSPEENAKFAEFRKKQEREAQAKADALVAEIYGDQGIFTEADLRQAQKELEAESKGLTTDEYEALQYGMTVKQKEAQKQSDIDAIISLAAKEGFNVSELPNEVLTEWNNGEGGRLVDIYKNHSNSMKETETSKKLSEMEKKIAEYEKALGIRQVNAENAESSTGGVSGTGASVGELTEEMIDNMSPKELSRRWDEVKKLRNMR